MENTQPVDDVSVASDATVGQEVSNEAPAAPQPQDTAPAPAPAEDVNWPEDVELAASDALKAEVVEWAKANKLTQAQMGEMLKLAERHAQETMEAFSAQVSKWAAAARADKDIGGDKLDGVLKTSRAFIEALPYADELKSVLASSGLGSHPAVIKLVYDAARRSGLAGNLDAPLASSKPAVDPAKRLFPNMN